MNEILLSKNIDELLEKTKEALATIEREELTLIQKSEKAIWIVDQSIREIKAWVSPMTFSSIAHEIRFFKTQKPQFIAWFIFYTQRIEIESSKPSTGASSLQKYYKAQVKNLITFFDENASFYNYYRREATYLDEKYFLRNTYDLKMKLNPFLHDYDPTFCTSHDKVVAQILANEMIEDFLLKQSTANETTTSSSNTLVWTDSKASLTELIFALHQSHVFNGGNVHLSEIVKSFEKAWDIDLGNYHKTLNEIRLRKTNATKFLHRLNENLTKYIENSLE